MVRGVQHLDRQDRDGRGTNRKICATELPPATVTLCTALTGVSPQRTPTTTDATGNSDSKDAEMTLDVPFRECSVTRPACRRRRLPNMSGHRPTAPTAPYEIVASDEMYCAPTSVTYQSAAFRNATTSIGATEEHLTDRSTRPTAHSRMTKSTIPLLLAGAESITK